MPDEANPSYVEMLDNIAVGHRAIAENFGESALPTLNWQIDPFGHSAFTGVLSSSLGGFRGVVWGREPSELKDQSRANGQRNLERVWTPSASLGGAAATFAAVFVDGGYDSPGPVSRCDQWTATNSSCNYAAAASDARGLADVVQQHASAVRGSDVLINMGTDFRWPNALDYFAYVDGLRDALPNASGGLYSEVAYSSAADYVERKLANVSSLPLLVGDLFPYSGGHDMWTGYFSSRPAFKAFVRESSALLQAARQLQALAGPVASLGPDNALFALERALGVCVHHDAISGTARDYVTKNYAALLEDGRAGAYASVAASLAALTGFTASPFALCPLANVSICPALEVGIATVAVVHNALGQPQDAAPVRLAVGTPPGVASFSVSDAAGRPVTAQLVPLSQQDRELRASYNSSAGGDAVAWLCFTAALPAAGFSAFFIEPAASASAAPHTHASALATVGGAGAGAGDGDVVLTNGRVTVTIGAATGFMTRYADAATGAALDVRQSWLAYTAFDGQSSLDGSNQASGAYDFRPASSTPLPLLPQGVPAAVMIATGPVVNVSFSVYGYVSVETRLWAGAAAAELEWTIGPVDVSDGQGREVITRFETGLASNGLYETDSNCREMIPRRLNQRANFTATVVEPAAGNYYPTPCLARVSGPDLTLAVAVDRAEGSASLADGQLELMCHRRLLHDDGKGVGEPLDEPGYTDGRGLVVRGRHWLAVAPAGAAAAAASKALLLQGLALPTAARAFAPLGALSPAQWRQANTASASLLAVPLPGAVHLATAHALSPTTLLLRLAHVFDAGEGLPVNASSSVALRGLFSGRAVASAVDMTLPGARPLASVARATYVTDGGETFEVPVLPAPPAGADLEVSLSAQQIRTLLVTFET